MMDMDMRRRIRRTLEQFRIDEAKLPDAEGMIRGPSKERQAGSEALIAALVREFFLNDRAVASDE